MIESEIINMLEEFGVNPDSKVKPFGDGHINKTFLVDDGNSKYVLQKVNTDIFTDFDGVMSNIERVCEHLDSKGCGNLQVIGYSSPWRLYNFIENSYSIYVLDKPEIAYKGARAFAQFQNRLADLPAPRLVETIPDFHNALWRLQQLDDAVKADVAGRAAECKELLDFVDKRRHYASRIIGLIEDGKIPERITHNDTKINNVMLDNNTDEVLAVVDLDTVMPGCALFDFGDMVRSATASAEEDETNLNRVFSKYDYFEALVRGYLSEAKFLNQYEIDNLAFSGISVTFTQVVRFLADYIAGDTYYQVEYLKHNYDRALNQMKMVLSLENQLDEYEQIVKDVVDGL